MDVRVGDSQRCKRKPRSEEDERWECSVCTYINPSESYKCEMCYMRKGTSTRKPRLNPQVVEQQQLIAQAILKEKDEDHRRRKEMKPNSLKMGSASSLKPSNIDRSSSLLFKVFANGYSVVITEFQVKPPLKSNYLDSPVTSNCSSLQSLTGVFSTNSEQFSPADSTHASSDRTGNLEAFTEYDLTDSSDVKVMRTSGPKLTSGVGTSNFEAVPHSHASSSNSSHGSNDPICSNSTPNSRHLSPVHAKPDPRRDAADAEQACKTCASDDLSASNENSVVFKDSREPGGDSKQTVASIPLRSLRSATGGLSTDVKAEAKRSLKKRRSLPDNTTVETSSLRRGYPVKSLCNPEVFPTALGLTSKQKRGRGQRISDVSKPLYTVHQKSPSASTSLAPIPPSPSWTSNRERCDPKGLSLRISVNSRSDAKALQSQPAHRTGDHRHETLPARDRTPQAKKRRHSSAQRAGLKCKIRVLHPSSPEEPDSRVVTYSASPSVEQKDSDVEVSGEPFASPITSCGGETYSGALHQRLSTESKNTSAMTDSSGANALEISH